MTTLVDAELADLKINIDDQEILNDLRVMIPHYSKTWAYVGEEVVVTWYDLIHTSIEGGSLNKYGRRSRINKYHVMDAIFEESWCEAQKQKYAEPYYKLDATIPGTDDNLVKCLATKLSDVLTVQNTVSGINNEYMVENYTLEVRPGFMVCKLGLKEMDTDQQLSLFVIDTDSIDGDHIIGW